MTSEGCCFPSLYSGRTSAARNISLSGTRTFRRKPFLHRPRTRKLVAVSLLLIGCHFVIPFVVLAFIRMKETSSCSAYRADVVPHALRGRVLADHADSFPLGAHCSGSISHVSRYRRRRACAFFSRFARHNLAPVNDPKLADPCSYV